MFDNYSLTIALMSKFDKVEVPVFEYQSNGIYVREMCLPAGVFAIGEEYYDSHMQMLLSGTIVMFDLDTNTAIGILEGPMILTSQPGRKAGYSLTDVKWCTIFATEKFSLYDYIVDNSAKIKMIEEEICPLLLLPSSDQPLLVV